MGGSAAPRLARLALWLIVARETRAHVRADLDEEFAVSVMQVGLRAARRWYWRYAMLSVWDWWCERARLVATWLVGVPTELRSSVRALRREPAVTLALLVTIVIGFAATTAVASIYWSVVLKPLPLARPDDVVRVSRTNGGVPAEWRVVGLPDLYEWRAHGSLEEVAGWTGEAVTLTGTGDAERIAALAVTDGLWRVLGASLARGRFFEPEEFRFGGHRVVVLEHAAWQRRFGGSDMVGRTLVLDGEPHEVVGVMAPRALEYPAVAELWRPLAPAPDSWRLQVRGASWLNAVGLLREGVTRETSQAGMSALQARLVREFPRDNEGQDGILLEPLGEVLAAPARAVLELMAGVIALVLLIACANASVLVLTRANRRRAELAVRRVIGGSSARIARQLLTEMLATGLVGGALGVLLAPPLVRAMLSLFPGGLARASEVRLSAGIVASVGAILGAALVAAALVPLRNTSGGLMHELRQTSSAGRRARWDPRGTLAVTQVALSVALCIGAFLLVSTLRNLDRIDPGFDAERVLTFQVSAPRARYPDGASRLFDTLLRELRAVPGVDVAGAANFVPFAPGEWGGTFEVPGEREAPTGIEANVRIGWGDYYDALGIPLIAGRVFDERDQAAAMPVAMLNRAAARAAFGEANPLGRAIVFEGEQREVVGILGDVKHHELAEEPAPEVHVPGAQFAQYAMTIVLRTGTDPHALVHAARDVVRRTEADLVITNLATMEERLRRSLEPERFRAALSSFLGVVALLLALAGVHGVMAHAVQQRVREIGIRMALGEARASVVRRVLIDSARLVSLGLVIGLVIAWWGAAWIDQFLFALDGRDPVVFAGVTAAFLGAGLLASWVPAWRAGRTDPMRVMRAE